MKSCPYKEISFKIFLSPLQTPFLAKGKNIIIIIIIIVIITLIIITIMIYQSMELK